MSYSIGKAACIVGYSAQAIEFKVFNTRCPECRRIGIIYKRARKIDIYIPEYRQEDTLLNPATLSLLFTILYTIEKQGILFHAAGIKFKNKAYLFAGPSRAGKSTLSNLLSGKVNVLSDEKVIVDRRRYLYGTPWSGDAGYQSIEKGKLKGIFFLKKGRVNKIEKITVREAYIILQQCFWAPYGNREGMEFGAEFILELLKTIPFYRLCFTKTALASRFLMNHIQNHVMEKG